jgi:hypothetical protein
LSLLADPGFFAHTCDCPTLREIAREDAEEERQRREGEGIDSPPDSDEEDEKQIVLVEGTEVEGGAMEIDA